MFEVSCIFALLFDTFCIYAVPRLQHVIKRKQSTLAATLPGAHSAVAHVSICLHSLPSVHVHVASHWASLNAVCSLLLQQQQRLSGALAQTAGLSNSARKQVGWWLAGCSGWVFSMVVLGGMTRLTRSGLSMTDWKFTGERPPQSLVH